MASTITTAYLVPLQPTPQLFDISLAGVTYYLKLRWNAPNQSWVLDIMDSNQNGIVTGIPLVTGTDLLAPYGYLNFGGSLVVQSNNNPDLVPDFNSLGTTGNLYFVVTSLAVAA